MSVSRDSVALNNLKGAGFGTAHARNIIAELLPVGNYDSPETVETSNAAVITPRTDDLTGKVCWQNTCVPGKWYEHPIRHYGSWLGLAVSNDLPSWASISHVYPFKEPNPEGDGERLNCDNWNILKGNVPAGNTSYSFTFYILDQDGTLYGPFDWDLDADLSKVVHITTDGETAYDGTTATYDPADPFSTPLTLEAVWRGNSTGTSSRKNADFKNKLWWFETGTHIPDSWEDTGDDVLNLGNTKGLSWVSDMSGTKPRIDITGVRHIAGNQTGATWNDGAADREGGCFAGLEIYGTSHAGVGTSRRNLDQIIFGNFDNQGFYNCVSRDAVGAGDSITSGTWGDSNAGFPMKKGGQGTAGVVDSYNYCINVDQVNCEGGERGGQVMMTFDVSSGIASGINILSLATGNHWDSVSYSGRGAVQINKHGGMYNRVEFVSAATASIVHDDFIDGLCIMKADGGSETAAQDGNVFRFINAPQRGTSINEPAITIATDQLPYTNVIVDRVTADIAVNYGTADSGSSILIKDSIANQAGTFDTPDVTVTEDNLVDDGTGTEDGTKGAHLGLAQGSGIVIVFQDTFTDTDATAITSHTPDIDTSGNGYTYTLSYSLRSAVNHTGTMFTIYNDTDNFRIDGSDAGCTFDVSLIGLTVGADTGSTGGIFSALSTPSTFISSQPRVRIDPGPFEKDVHQHIAADASRYTFTASDVREMRRLRFENIERGRTFSEANSADPNRAFEAFWKYANDGRLVRLYEAEEASSGLLPDLTSSELTGTYVLDEDTCRRFEPDRPSAAVDLYGWDVTLAEDA